jgi:hypothetical protein
MSAPSLIERVKTSLVGLKMPRALEVLDVTCFRTPAPRPVPARLQRAGIRNPSVKRTYRGPNSLCGQPTEDVHQGR